MFKNILIVLVVLLAGFAVLVSRQPAHFRVERSATIAAPAGRVFPLVDNLRKWHSWSPWVKLDPAVKESFEGPVQGVGASFSWAGNNSVGEGKMTITESRPSRLIRMKLEFLKPMKAVSTAEFTFINEGVGTVVTWSMSGENGFIGKAMHLTGVCDRMVGGQFEKGLASMKTLAEAR